MNRLVALPVVYILLGAMGCRPAPVRFVPKAPAVHLKPAIPVRPLTPAIPSGAAGALPGKNPSTIPKNIPWQNRVPHAIDPLTSILDADPDRLPKSVGDLRIPSGIAPKDNNKDNKSRQQFRFPMDRLGRQP